MLNKDHLPLLLLPKPAWAGHPSRFCYLTSSAKRSTTPEALNDAMQRAAAQRTSDASTAQGAHGSVDDNATSPRGPQMRASVGPNSATPGAPKSPARCSGPESAPITPRAERIKATSSARFSSLCVRIHCAPGTDKPDSSSFGPSTSSGVNPASWSAAASSTIFTGGSRLAPCPAPGKRSTTSDSAVQAESGKGRGPSSRPALDNFSARVRCAE